MSVGTIIDQSWSHYRQHFIELMSVAAWLILPTLLYIVSTWFYPDFTLGLETTFQFQTKLSPSETFGIILYAVNFFLITPIISLWVSNTLIRLLDREWNKVSVRLRQLSREGWRLFFPRLLVGVIMTLILLAPIIIFVISLVVSGSFLREEIGQPFRFLISALAPLGFLIMVAGLLLFGLRLYFAKFALLVDGEHGRAAINSSWQMTRGLWWPTFWRLIVPKVVFMTGFLVLQFLFSGLLRLLTSNIAGLNFELGVRLDSIGSAVIIMILGAIATPLLLNADFLVFRGLRETRGKKL